jgi:hypothetical protein
MKIYKYWLIGLMIISISNPGCKKVLETKPDSKLAVPSTPEDLQAMLDTYYKLNERESALGETSADNYYLTSDLFKAVSSEDERNTYLWSKNILFSNQFNDWYNLYEKVNYANAVIEAYHKMAPAVRAANADILGQALVFRASAFLSATVIWSSAYNKNTSGTDLGIPLRLNTNFNEVSVRASVQQCYTQIISDLKQAAAVSVNKPIHVIRPSKPAVYGFLSRTYLFMGDYEMAGKYADSCLQLRSELIDYNDINTAAALPFSRFNKEVIFEVVSPSSTPIFSGLIDSLLYASYDTDDLRKASYLRENTGSTFKFKGSYEGHKSKLFFGLATDEMYLTRAECYARSGKLTDALKDINFLMTRRWKKTKYTDFSSDNREIILNKILEERRKELIFRGLRWADLKRFNLEQPAPPLVRNINGVKYKLPANDSRYALPIPQSVIQITGMPQN